MDIKTKFNMNDTIYYINNNAICSGSIYRIRIDHGNTSKDSTFLNISYIVNGPELHENNVYATKEEAALAWLKSQGLDCGVTHV